MVVIAVSGKPGSGSSTVARLLAKKLGLNYFSPGGYLKTFSKSEGETDKALDVLKSTDGMSKAFHSRIDELQITRAKRGDVVIDGKLSLYFLRGLANPMIWLDCDIETRAERTAKRDNISVSEARRKLELRQRIDSYNFEKFYGLKMSSLKSNATLVIDVSSKNLEEIISEIEKYLSSTRQIKK